MKITIGNSETNTFLKCERRHYYEFILKRAPKKHTGALAIGIVGHDALMHYYKAKQALDTEEEAQNKALSYCSELSLQDMDYMETCSEVRRILKGYFDAPERYDDDMFEIIAVEEKYSIPLTDKFDYGMRLDLLVKFHEGQYKGQYGLVDHKFTYNFWTQDALQINGQLPKYIAALRQNGYPDLKVAVVNQIRYRKIKEPTSDQLFRRSFITPSDVEINSIMIEQIKSGLKVWKRHQVPVSVAEAESTRTMSKDMCERCFYIQPCKIDLTGGNSELELKANYIDNTHAYSNIEDE